MRRRLTRSCSNAGLTLVELAVAILVLALAGIAALRAADQSRLAIGGEAPRVLARIAARNRAEELQLYGTGRALPPSTLLGGQAIALDTRTQTTAGGLIQATVTARAPGGAGAQVVVYLAPGVRR